MNTQKCPNPRLICVSNLGNAGVLVDHITFMQASTESRRLLETEFELAFVEIGDRAFWYANTGVRVNSIRDISRLIKLVHACFGATFDFEYFYEKIGQTNDAA